MPSSASPPAAASPAPVAIAASPPSSSPSTPTSPAGASTSSQPASEAGSQSRSSLRLSGSIQVEISPAAAASTSSPPPPPASPHPVEDDDLSQEDPEPGFYFGANPPQAGSSSTSSSSSSSSAFKLTMGITQFPTSFEEEEEVTDLDSPIEPEVAAADEDAVNNGMMPPPSPPFDPAAPPHPQANAIAAVVASRTGMLGAIRSGVALRSNPNPSNWLLCYCFGLTHPFVLLWGRS